MQLWQRNRARVWLVILFLSWALSFYGEQKSKAFRGHEEFLTHGLRQIFLELQPVALVTPEGLRVWQSFLGQDPDDTYKEDMLFIIIRDAAEESLLLIQVQKMRRHPDNPRWQSGLEARSVAAVIKGEKVVIENCDFSPEELGRLIPDMLQSIREKKKMLGIKIHFVAKE